MTTATFEPSAPTNLTLLLERMREGSRALWISTLAMTVLAAICLALQFIDPRMVGDANTWHKPAKFFLSIAVQFATVSWALTLLPAAERVGRLVRTCCVLMIGSGWFEMAYIVFRAARAEASHFNTATPVASVAYSLMGLGALTLTGTAFIIGWRLWKHRRHELVMEATAIGLMLGAVLATLAGGYMSSQTGHGVGEVPGTGVGFFGWSTTGGDLRIAHFMGLHAMQLVPLAALTERRVTVLLTALICALLTALLFLQALAGMPLLRS